jgi:hypothetical protein
MAERILDSLNALLSSHTGASAPSYAEEGAFWLSTAAALRVLSMSDGTDWLKQFLLNATTNTAVPYTLFGPAIDIASAATVNLATVGSNHARVTGTTTITSFGTSDAGVTKVVRFAGALTITYNATSMILAGGNSAAVQSGDVYLMQSEGSGNWRELFRSRQPSTISPITTYVANGTHVVTPGTTALLAFIQAAGGGGGYANSNTGESAAGTGGGGGMCAIKLIQNPTTSYAVVVGAGGLGGTLTPSATPATAGGLSSFGAFSAEGGPAGTQSSSTASPGTIAGVEGGDTGNGDMNIPGGGTEPGIILSSASAIGSKGGDSFFGKGGRASVSSNGGESGRGYGGGGGGASSSNNADRDGADGLAGIVYVVEFA